MKSDYARLDMIRLYRQGIEINWLHSAADCTYDLNIACFYVLKGSKTYTKIIIMYGDVFE